MAHSISFHEDFKSVSRELGSILCHDLLRYPVDTEPFPQDVESVWYGRRGHSLYFRAFGECNEELETVADPGFLEGELHQVEK